jgi:hypothetical protein
MRPTRFWRFEINNALFPFTARHARLQYRRLCHCDVTDDADGRINMEPAEETFLVVTCWRLFSAELIDIRHCWYYKLSAAISCKIRRTTCLQSYWQLCLTVLRMHAVNTVRQTRVWILTRWVIMGILVAALFNRWRAGAPWDFRLLWACHCLHCSWRILKVG